MPTVIARRIFFALLAALLLALVGLNALLAHRGDAAMEQNREACASTAADIDLVGEGAMPPELLDAYYRACL